MILDNQHKQIKGYRDLSQEEIDLMNKIKALAERLKRQRVEYTKLLRVINGNVKEK